MGTPRTLVENVIDKQVSALQALYAVVETKTFLDIVKHLTMAALCNYERRIIMTGVGKNANIAAKIAETMASLGIPAFYLNTAHTGHGDYGFVGPRDVIVHISRSGTTREMLDTIDHLKLIRPQVTQVLIHCKPEKPNNPLLDYELCIGKAIEGDEFQLAPTTSTTALLCILDCIAVQVSHNIGFKRLDFLKFHPDGALGAMLKAEVNKTANHTDLANVPAEVVTIGSEPALASLISDEALDQARKIGQMQAGQEAA